MNIECIKVDKAIDMSEHGRPFINPYNGCTIGCPFCYWLDFPGWEGRIQLRGNIADELDKLLQNWDKDRFIYMGSYCDPFMETEREHRLARACLDVIVKHKVPLLITTSAVTDIILEYIPIFKQMQARLIIVAELCRIPYLEGMKNGKSHPGIENANQLLKSGLEVWATLAPILPGVTDLDDVLHQLDSKIPVYVDSLQTSLATVNGRRVLEWVQQDYPQLLPQYKEILEQGDLRYFERFMEEYKNKPRVKRFPFEM